MNARSFLIAAALLGLASSGAHAQFKKPVPATDPAAPATQAAPAAPAPAAVAPAAPGSIAAPAPVVKKAAKKAPAAAPAPAPVVQAPKISEKSRAYLDEVTRILAQATRDDLSTLTGAQK